MKIKTGYHAVYAESYFSGIDDAKKYGFEFVQFELGVPAYFLNKSTKEKLLEIKIYAEDSGVEVTFHLPSRQKRPLRFSSDRRRGLCGLFSVQAVLG